MFWKRVKEYLVLGLVGGGTYYTLEILFRGFSHWSMFLLGGIAMIFCAMQGRSSGWNESILVQIGRCTIFIVSCEFITGLIVNKWLRWGIWDYSAQPFQLFGQICLPFAGLFSVLAALAIVVSGYLLHWFFSEKKPEYHIL